MIFNRLTITKEDKTVNSRSLSLKNFARNHHFLLHFQMPYKIFLHKKWKQNHKNRKSLLRPNVPPVTYRWVYHEWSGTCTERRMLANGHYTQHLFSSSRDTCDNPENIFQEIKTCRNKTQKLQDLSFFWRRMNSIHESK